MANNRRCGRCCYYRVRKYESIYDLDSYTPALPDLSPHRTDYSGAGKSRGRVIGLHSIPGGEGVIATVDTQKIGDQWVRISSDCQTVWGCQPEYSGYPDSRPVVAGVDNTHALGMYPYMQPIITTLEGDVVSPVTFDTLPDGAPHFWNGLAYSLSEDLSSITLGAKVTPLQPVIESIRYFNKFGSFVWETEISLESIGDQLGVPPEEDVLSRELFILRAVAGSSGVSIQYPNNVAAYLMPSEGVFVMVFARWSWTDPTPPMFPLHIVRKIALVLLDPSTGAVSSIETLYNEEYHDLLPTVVSGVGSEAQVLRLTPMSLVDSDDLVAVMNDAEGLLVYRYAMGSPTLEHYLTIPTGLIHHAHAERRSIGVHSKIIVDREGGLIIRETDDVLSFVRGQKLHFITPDSHRVLDFQAEDPPWYCSTMTVDDNGCLWVGGGPYKYEKE